MKFSHTLSSVLGFVTLVTLSNLYSGVSATAIPLDLSDCDPGTGGVTEQPVLADNSTSPINGTSPSTNGTSPTDGTTPTNGTTPSNGTSPPNGTTPSNGNPSSNGSPRFVAYWDAFVAGQTGPPDPSTFKGYNVINLAFLLSTGPADQAQAWSSLSDSQRSSVKSAYNAAGIKLVVSAFGSTEVPTTSGQDPTQLAQTMANFVKTNGLDGIDVDYEDFGAISAGTAVNWLVSFTKALRDNLPAGQFLITHAPVAPWFSPSLGAPYLEVHKQVGDLIDFYNVQFYNQGAAYTTCDGLLTSSTEWPGSSVFEMSQAGVPLDKIVIGKPAISSDASNGFVDTQTLAQCVSQGAGQGWNGGVMVWQYPHADSSWISTVRGSAFPV